MKYTYDKESNEVWCEPSSAEDWIIQLQEVAGYDYDGYNDIKNLKSLIDEMRADAKKAYNCLKEGKVYSDYRESYESYQKAYLEKFAHTPKE